MAVIHSYCFLFILLFSVSVAATVASRTPEEDLLYLPCPNPLDILPCVCSVDNETHMNMDCSDVASEEELAHVFTAYFPFFTFDRLIIKGNMYLKVLRAGDLGNASFHEFHISDGVLEVVEEMALIGSISTATIMYFNSNQLTGFLFEHLYLFTRLQYLDISFNCIQEYPFIYSQTLTYLDLSGNLFGHLPYIAFKNLPSLVFVYLDMLAIQEIEPGTFSGFESLQLVSLSHNLLTRLPEGALEVSRPLALLGLSYNNIGDVAVNAFSGFANSVLYLNENALTELEEQVWRPLLEENNYLHLRSNPLTCGCDIAWIMLNTTLLSLVSVDTTCASGETLVNLDPSYYEQLC
ncbi:oplophorus-luciferin 2-monooxygenase non-catalytic subunit-like [Panulirus ornatus]|uniref:oplophorus-luciferin 2-monooxygenase non-catalytic subunit-like n=1 Tax=Panulirus ornatus TaxID=150431 RepID=UPI003A880F46